MEPEACITAVYRLEASPWLDTDGMHQNGTGACPAKDRNRTRQLNVPAGEPVWAVREGWAFAVSVENLRRVLSSKCIASEAPRPERWRQDGDWEGTDSIEFRPNRGHTFSRVMA
jgi:hypothetical protein